MKTRTVDVYIKNHQTDEIVFQQDAFEVPVDWSDSAATIAASKYATGGENSVLEIVERITSWIVKKGQEQGYSISRQFKTELEEILLDQRAAFNSPTWFNAGIAEEPQCAACFILPVEDTMEDILQHTVRAGRIFKQGSGVGLNVSKLRAKGEALSNRGTTSGPLSFMEMWDACAGSIRSGGRTRRSAVLICMDADHPDILDFVECKKLEEDKAKLLMEKGLDPEEAYRTVCFQNANHSIRVTDCFMGAANYDLPWRLTDRGDGAEAREIRAKEILRRTAEIAWETGDPGIQFHDQMNKDNPVPTLGEIRSTNPCQPGWATVLTPEGVKTFDEIDVGSTIWSGKQWTKVTHKVPTGTKEVFVYGTEKGKFCGTEEHFVFSHGSRIKVEQAPSIDLSPRMPDSEEVEDRSLPILYKRFASREKVWDIRVEAEEHSYWTDGLLVSNCAELSAIDNSACNLASLNLLKYHIDNTKELDWDLFYSDIKTMITAMDILIDASSYPTPEIAKTVKETRPLGLGYTNLGALLMCLKIPYNSEEACETVSNITKQMTTAAYQQSVALAKEKGPYPAFEDNRATNIDLVAKLTHHGVDHVETHGLRNSQVTLLAPTGTISILMDCDSTGIEPLFSLKTVKNLSGGGIMAFTPHCVKNTLSLMGKDKIEDLSEEEKDIFKTANDISWKSHVDIVAAAQKHLNGSVSKTVSLPSNATVEDVEEAYLYAWKKELKAVSIYRDGSKALQPLTTANDNEDDTEEEMTGPQWQPVRKKLPPTRQSLTHNFNISGLKGFIQPSVYEDGSVGELFLRVQKQGSTISGLMDSFAVVVSLALQYGVPLEVIVDKMVQTKFDPQGFTGNEDIPMTSSIMDYIFRWLAQQFIDDDDEEEETMVPKPSYLPEMTEEIDASGPPCVVCGSITIRNGTCYYCPTCGSTTGCS